LVDPLTSRDSPRSLSLSKKVQVLGPLEPGFEEILTTEALEFLHDLHLTFNARRLDLLRARDERQRRLLRGERPDFLPATRPVREGDWRVGPIPKDLTDRRVEITGPVDRKMMINALNSGANVYMADFEDANSPTWANTIQGQRNLIDAYERRLDFTSPDGKEYRLAPKTATLVVRPRGWHLDEKHLRVEGEALSASLVDFGLYAFHCGARAVRRGTGPYLYLPKMESHLEARLWNDVFVWSQERLGLTRGTIKATVLIETILAALEMDEILHELREHAAGLNAGRWDYIFSLIKKFRADPAFVLPDRAQVTMTVPFMRAYTELLVQTCHRRGAFAMGGMAAFVPNRRDPQATETALSKVREDKLRESKDGFDGTWVAHPDLVPVAKEVFDAQLGRRPNQLDRQRPDVRVEARHLLDVRVPGGAVTEAGVRNNLSVAVQYLESWLRGSGAVAIHNLMEDAATAEIARSQVWQWVRHGTKLADGRPLTRDLARRLLDEEMAKLAPEAGPGRRFDDARRLVERLALGEDFPDFLTIPAYELIE
jgi:malate synthase